MRNRRIYIGFVLACYVALVSGHVTASALPTVSCDVSGPFTDRLCPGDVLDDGEYIVSPNGQWRMYYSGNQLVVYDTFDDWSVGGTFSGVTGSHTPDEFVYSDSSVTTATGDPVNFAFYGDDDELLWAPHTHVFPPDQRSEVSGQHAFIIKNNGFVQAEDSIGQLFLALCPHAAC